METAVVSGGSTVNRKSPPLLRVFPLKLTNLSILLFIIEGFAKWPSKQSVSPTNGRTGKTSTRIGLS